MNERVLYLLSQYEKNNCSRGEMEELFGYIRNLETNDDELKAMVKRVYDNICKDHPSFSYVTPAGELVFSEPDQPEPISHFTTVEVDNLRVITIYRRILIVAAVLIVSSLVLIGIKRFSDDRKNMQAQPVVHQVYETAVSQTKTFYLPDSTQVRLNAGSTLITPTQFSGSARKVELSGEAVFRIRKNKAGSFIIQTAEAAMIAEDNATCNVKAYHDENNTVLTVSEGLVKVKKNDRLITTLGGGRMIKFGKAENSITEKNYALQNFAAWQWGELIYDNVMFKDVLLDLQRRYDLKLDYQQSPKLKMNISVSFKNGTEIQEVLQSLASITQSQFEETEDRVFVIR